MQNVSVNLCDDYNSAVGGEGNNWNTLQCCFAQLYSSNTRPVLFPELLFQHRRILWCLIKNKLGVNHLDYNVRRRFCHFAQQGKAAMICNVNQSLKTSVVLLRRELWAGGVWFNFSNEFQAQDI